jgi:hypothetical protein
MVENAIIRFANLCILLNVNMAKDVVFLLKWILHVIFVISLIANLVITVIGPIMFLIIKFHFADMGKNVMIYHVLSNTSIMSKDCDISQQ